MNVARKRTLPGDKDGPGQKRLAHTSKQDGQAQESATKEDACIPQQVLPPLSLSEEMEVQKRLDACTKSIWSGTLKYHTRPQSQSNDQKQAMVISGCRLHSHVQINSVNWPKQLKMTTISCVDYWKLELLRVKRTSRWVTFSMDEDCDNKSYRAFIQSTSEPNWGCVLLEYTSSGISLLSLISLQFRDEVVIIGHMLKYTYQDPVVEFLTDLGILSHATTANMRAQEITSLKEELQQKDKVMVEQQILHQEEMEIKNKIMEKKSEQLARIEEEKDALMTEKDKDLRKLDTLKKEMERLEKILVEQKHLVSKERTKIMAESWRNQERIRKEVEAEKTQETLMLTSQLIKIETSHSELEKEVHTIKQATLDDLEKELKCSICQQIIIEATTLICGHSFCTKCVEDMVNHNEEAPCPNCRKPWETNVPSVVIDSCIQKINESRLEDEARQAGDETETDSEGELIRGELEVRSQSVSEESDDDPSPVSPSSSGSSASSYCRASSSIEDMFSSDSSSDSD